MLEKLPTRLAAPLVAAVITSAVVAAIALGGSSGTQAVPAGSPPAPTGQAAGQLVIEDGTPIPILSYSWGVSNPSSGSIGGGAGAGKASFSSLNLMKSVDASSAALTLACASGEHFQKATFTVQWGTGLSAAKLVFTLKNVNVDSIQQSGSGGGAPTESLSLGYTQIQWEFTDGNGAKTGGGWDIPGNTGG
jgi:type VI secretion system secreted protein Hcp